MSSYNLMLGNCLDTLKTLEDNSVDSIVTDPPYGLAFMGKKWDYDVPDQKVWEECLRVLKPGGHLLAFAGTRTQHRMCVRIEDAGFEIRDMIAWVYGSGFPKSMDVSKAIDKAAGVLRGTKYEPHGANVVFGEGKGKAAGVDRSPGALLSDPAVTEAAREWQGWGTCLKPALEPITLARKPLGETTVAKNVLKHGTGGINVDGCRVGDETRVNNRGGRRAGTVTGGSSVGGTSGGYNFGKGGPQTVSGRFPANLIHDGSPEIQEVFGEASRFFYCAKASKQDREEGLDNATQGSQGAKGNGLARVCASCGTPQLKAADCKCETKEWVNPSNRKNFHPTVKPTMLMQYLCRLITPPGGTVLDPFMGSGSTGKAAMLEGFGFIGCELDENYLKIAQARIEHAKATKEKELPL